MASNSLLLRRLLTWLAVALLAVAALRLAFFLLGVAWQLGVFLLFTVVPVLLVGWLAVKVFRFFTRDPEY